MDSRAEDRDAWFNKGFNEGILNALALMVAHGDGSGTMYEELMNIAGADKVIAYARQQNCMRWAGLDKYVRFLKENAELTGETP